MTGLTRNRAARTIAQYLGTRATHVGGAYDTYTVRDLQGRTWKVVSDSSIDEEARGNREATTNYRVEVVSPICKYEDIPTVQEIVRQLRHSGAKVNASCGIHIHVDASRHNPQTLRNIVNIMASKEELLYKTLKVESWRERQYCKKADLRFLDEVNTHRPKTMEQIERQWYNGESGRNQHYDASRYHALNLHSVFSKGTIEFRMFNSTLHAGEVKSYIQLCLAISHQALVQRTASRSRTQSSNEKYTFRTWLLRLGMIGDEFKTARQHLLKNLDGNIAWRDPAQAQEQRERQLQQRLEQQAQTCSSAVGSEQVQEARQQEEEPAISQELNEYIGHVYTAILSIRREEAERLGFDNGSRWRDMLRSQTQTISENLKIPMDHLRWYAAYHDEGHHPHIHMIVYSSVPGEGYLSDKGIEKMRSSFARDIFTQDMLHIYEKQTEIRDHLREQGRESVAEIVAQINSGIYSNSKVEALLVSLSDRLFRTSGKKVYGYLKADVKAIVDQIVAELAADERIRKLYDLWYEQREDVLRTYTDHFPERVPLEQNKEFKAIRNAVIQEAMKIVSGIQQAAELEPRQDVWDVGLPTGGDSDLDAMADPSYWMEQFRPRFTEAEPVVSEPDPVDMEPEDTTTIRSSDSKEWWSDYYKLARKYLYGNKVEKPDFQKAMPLLLLEASRGNGYACYDLGRMHLLGQGCKEDEEEAQRWLRDALEAFMTAEQTAEKKGYLRYRIGKCHAYGHGTEQNYEVSARWFRQAVDENNPFAAYSLGGQYLRGQGVEQSDTETYSLFYMAATHEKQPNAYAQYQLGKMYRDGTGTEVNLEESKLWFSRAYIGFLAMEESMADDRLYYRLGSMNMTGTGTKVDLEQARYYFEKAAELGNADALYGLGKLYLKPEFPAYDPAKAVEYLERSAAKGNAFAKYQLGKLLCQGELVHKDIARGLPLLEELAQNGVTFASYIAGKVYLREEGWQDIKKAILYFRQAAEDGNSFAEYQLGRIYYFGNGVRVDREKGLEFLKESVAHGNEYAANLLQVIQQQHTWGVASCTASLIAQLGRLFQEQDQKQNQRQRPCMDRKHRREIEEKKMAMGIRE